MNFRADEEIVPGIQGLDGEGISLDFKNPGALRDCSYMHNSSLEE